VLRASECAEAGGLAELAAAHSEERANERGRLACGTVHPRRKARTRGPRSLDYRAARARASCRVDAEADLVAAQAGTWRGGARRSVCGEGICVRMRMRARGDIGSHVKVDVCAGAREGGAKA